MKKSITLFALILLSVSLLFTACQKDEDEPEEQLPTYDYIENFSIVIFGSSQCFYCADLEEEMDKLKIPYTSYDTQEDAHNAAMWQTLHDNGYTSSYVDLPVVKVTTDSMRLLIQPDLYDDIIPLITE